MHESAERGKFPRRIGPIEETRKEGLSKALIYVLGAEVEVPYVRLLPTTMLAFFRSRLILVTVYTVCYASDRVERLSSRRSRILTHRDHRDLENLARVLRAMLFSRNSSDEDGTGEAETVCKVSETSRVSPYRFPLEFFPLLPIARWRSMKRKSTQRDFEM